MNTIFLKKLWWPKKLLIGFCALVLLCVIPMFLYAIWLGAYVTIGWPVIIGIVILGIAFLVLSGNPAFKVFFGSRRWWPVAFSGATTIICLIILSVMFAREWADWTFAFGEIIQKGAKNGTDWPNLVRVIIGIVFVLGLIEVCIGIVSRWFVLIWRVAWMRHFMEPWLLSRKHIDGAAQTMTDIINQYTQKALDYGKAFFRAYSVLCTFGPKLWVISESFKISFFRNVPGALVYVTVAVSIICVLVAYFCSLKLETCQTVNIENEKKTRSAYEKFEQKKPAAEDVSQAKESLSFCINRLKTGYIWYAIHYLLYEAWLNWYGKFWVIAPIAFFGLYVTNLQASYGTMSQALSIINEFHGAIIFLAYIWGDFQTFRVLRDNLFSFAKALETKPPLPELLRHERRFDRREGCQ